MKFLKVAFFILFILINISCGHTTQRPNNHDDDSNPLLDMASAFLQETLSQQGGNGGVSGIVGVASLIGNLMQNNADINGNDNGNSGGSKSNSGASQILSKISSFLTNSNRGGNNGFDSTMFGNVLEMFENVDSLSQNDEQNRQKRNLNDNNINDNNINNNNNNNNQNDDSGFGLDSILQIASTLIASQQQSQDKNRSNQDNGGFMMSILPMVMQAINTFSGPEGQRTQEKHKEHAWILPPLLEQMHVLWDHFSNSELAEALWQKSGVNSIFKGFTGRDGKLDYDRLFESLHNQSFRRRWIKAATLYLADWANYFADPEVYQRYLKAGVLLFNGFLKSQGFPSATYFDPIRPSETISNLLDHIASKHLNVKVDSRQYVLPAVSYAKELLKLGQARGLIQKFNATELSDKLTDTLNLEVIEPVLKVHRAYRFAIETPHCDKYILCQLNSHDPNEKLGLAGFKPGITKFGSMAAAWFISLRSGTPFWTLISTVNEPYNCEIRFPVDCTAFHEGEAKVTTEYFHNEL